MSFDQMNVSSPAKQINKADIEFDMNQKSSLRKSSMASSDIQGGCVKK